MSLAKLLGDEEPEKARDSKENTLVTTQINSLNTKKTISEKEIYKETLAETGRIFGKIGKKTGEIVFYCACLPTLFAPTMVRKVHNSSPTDCGSYIALSLLFGTFFESLAIYGTAGYLYGSSYTYPILMTQIASNSLSLGYEIFRSAHKRAKSKLESAQGEEK